MNGDVIREFLVGLGFQVDEAGLRRFNEGLRKATKEAMNLAKEVVAAGAAVAAGVVKIAGQFEDLFYASQRLRSSVTDIKAFTFGVSQLGGNAKQARQDLENMMRAMRENPGNEGIFRALGIQSRDAEGHLKGATDLASGLGKAYKEGDDNRKRIVVQYAQMLGVSEETLQAMARDTGEFSAQYAKMAKSMGMSQDEAAESSAKFMQQIRTLLAWIELAAGKLAAIAEGPIGRIIKVITKADEATGGWASSALVLAGILGTVAAIVGPVAALVLALAGAILLLWDDFQTWKEGGTSLIDWDKWAPGIDAAMAALGALWDAVKALWAALVQVGDSLGITNERLGVLARGGLAIVTGELNSLADLLQAIAAFLRGDFSAAWDHAANIAKRDLSFFRKGWEWFTTGKDPTADPATDGGDTSSQAEHAANVQGGGGQSPVGRSAKDIQARADYLLNYLKSHGISDNVARGSVAGALAENDTLDPGRTNSIGALGIEQLLGSRKKGLIKRYGHHPTLAQEAEFWLWELNGGDPKHGGAAVLAAKSAQEAGYAYITKFMRPGDGTPGDLRRMSAALSRMGSPSATPLMAQAAPAAGGGARPVSINQNTNINVAPGPDAEGTARRVLAEQGRINGDLYRNTIGAVR